MYKLILFLPAEHGRETLASRAMTRADRDRLFGILMEALNSETPFYFDLEGKSVRVIPWEVLTRCTIEFGQ